MYTSRIITIIETRVGNNETESERRFLEGVEGQEGATGLLHAKPGRTHHASALQEQRWADLGVRAPRARPRPTWHRLGPPRSCRQH
jgi:hypothetical protein